jgi:hypothetical protein
MAKPRYKMTAKSKETKATANLAAIWERDNGYLGGELDRDVDFIMMKNGAKITNVVAYINMFDNGGEQNQELPAKVQEAEQVQAVVDPKNAAYEGDNDDCPF